MESIFRKSSAGLLVTFIAVVNIGLFGELSANADPSQDGSFSLVQSEADWTLVEKSASGVTLDTHRLSGDHGSKILQADGYQALVSFSGLDGLGLPMAIVSSAKGLQISWLNKVLKSEVRVYANGLELTSKNKAEYGFQRLVSNPGTQLTITAIRERAPNSEKSLYAMSDVSQQVVFIPQSSTPQALSTALLAPTQASVTKFRQNAFIPDQYLDAPATVCTPTTSSKYRFVGDNRSWSAADSAPVRTRMDVSINWLGAPDVSFSKTVGTTHRQVLTASGIWVNEAVATAPSDSMTMSVQSKSQNSAIVRLHQDVTNPLCNGLATNGIYADTLLAIYRTGQISGSITYLAMPNYELYARQDSGPYSTIARLPYWNVYCLIKTLGGLACTPSVGF